ncbi:3-oxoacyl-[acyl-carrier-protein] synthase III C-terminal domain-containing protein [Streptomyces sp. NPDC127068]|uniref:3-oxoacyl-[acyl-carrier-protein] synthase III C-terminal domain-containing protein n=1 Tax=Streptomyces sp. NPDC127068 TaxID=3347127 RepID=UPI00365F139E
MGARAAELAAVRAGLGTRGIDCVVAVTTSRLAGDGPLAGLIAERLPGGCRGSLDVDVESAGFCAALELARYLIIGGSFRRVAVVGVERARGVVDGRSSRVPFTGGAGAAVVTDAPEPGIGTVAWGGDRSRPRPFAPAPATGSASPLVDSGTPRAQDPEAYRWLLEALLGVARTALRRAGVTPADLAAFIPHQSNDRVLSALVTALGLPAHVVVAPGAARIGNTSAVSIPMAMDTLLKETPRVSGGLALLLGYGAGVEYAAQVIRLP